MPLSLAYLGRLLIPLLHKEWGTQHFYRKQVLTKIFLPVLLAVFAIMAINSHEGLDLYPIRRDSRGYAEDSIYAAMDGIVSHVNSISGHLSLIHI